MTNKVTDQLSLLEMMVSDTADAPAEFSIDGPTAGFLQRFQADLREKGLRKMALEGSRLLNTIGACNYSPLQQMHYNLEQRLEAGEIDRDEHRLLAQASGVIFDKHRVNLLPYELSLEDLNHAAYRACELYARATGAKPPGAFSFSDAFYPEYMFEIEGRRYSYLGLYYYCRYAFCAQYVDFDKLENVVEIGSGSGRAVEIIKKLHPRVTFHLLDLAPQLYVSQRFLESLFPEDIVNYELTRRGAPARTVKPGGIHFYPHYRIADLQLEGPTLSWNTMVFCIMSPDRAKRYFDEMRRLAEHVYVVEPTTAAGGAQYGLSEPNTFEHYARFMNDGYRLVAR